MVCYSKVWQISKVTSNHKKSKNIQIKLKLNQAIWTWDVYRKPSKTIIFIIGVNKLRFGEDFGEAGVLVPLKHSIEISIANQNPHHLFGGEGERAQNFWPASCCAYDDYFSTLYFCSSKIKHVIALTPIRVVLILYLLRHSPTERFLKTTCHKSPNRRTKWVWCFPFQSTTRNRYK